MTEQVLTDEEIQIVIDLVHERVSRELTLSDQQVQIVAEAAATVAINRVYQEVGRSVLKKFTWLVGVVVVGIAIWLAGTGNIPK